MTDPVIVNDQYVTVHDMPSCARCKTTAKHPSPTMTFRRFSANPVDADGQDYWYWAMCPVTGEPVVMRIDRTTTVDK